MSKLAIVELPKPKLLIFHAVMCPLSELVFVISNMNRGRLGEIRNKLPPP